MQKVLMMLGAVLAWAMPMLAATHDGVQLWENGPLWAKTNVGANSPTETGYYFWWGDTLGYKWQNNQWVASDGSKTGYSFSASTNGKTLDQLQTMGAVGADGNLLPAYDAAAQQWGDDWRIPKASEYRNLIELCTWSWTTNNSVIGYSVTGKGLYSGNSIFLPAAGYATGTTTNCISTHMFFWGATASSDSTGTLRLLLSQSGLGYKVLSGRSTGGSIRPVKSFTASKQSAAAALDTRTGTRVVASKENIAYDTAWGGASSGTLKVNGTAVSGLSSEGTYAWTPNSSQTNYWKLTYVAGTANYAATFRSNTYTLKYNANGGSGSMSTATCTYGQNATLAANGFSRPGYAFLGWSTSPNGAVVYTDKQSFKNQFSEGTGTLNLYAKWTDKWYVDDASGDDANDGLSASTAFKTIQHAIDLTVPGMTIVVADGTYAPINSGNKSITIRSVNGAARTIIDGGYPAATNRCVYAGGNDGRTNTVIRGFTIQNGCTSGTASGAGVAGGTLYDCVVRDNHSAMSGGGTCYSTLYNCIVEGNSCGNHGGGAYLPIAYDCVFINNACATNGAGVSQGVLNNCTVISNRSELSGGGVYATVLTNCVVCDNVALANGGGAYGGSLYGCTITNNIAYQYGGGVNRSTVENCIISGNAAYIAGGGAYLAICHESEIRGNKATSNGGGVYESRVYNSELSANESGQHGGAAFRGELQNCLIYGNRAPSGNGGGIVNAVARNCTIYNNVCSGRGGGANTGLDNGYAVGTNFNCIVYGNTAGQDTEIDTRVPSFNCCTDDPHFIRAEAGDFRLRCDSPCIDAGDKTYVTMTTDFAGNPRIVNNKVDIGAYEFSAALDRHFTVQVANGTGGAIYYEGDTVTIAAEDRSPRYTFTRWTGDVSVLKNVNGMTNTFTMPTRNLAFTAEYDDLQQYLVIDLSGGVNAASYPVSYLTDVPAGGWTDTYKTTKLVMRRIDPGTFTMGSPEGEAGRRTNETPHQVTLTHSYYIGVFELTQRQWELVMGTRPSVFSNTVCYATRPVERVSYNQIRGSDLGRWWPQMNTVDESSFMGKLRAKTGRLFDLPTEAQWEYACRAGTTTAYNSGKNYTGGVDANMAEVGRYYYNSGAYDNSYDYNGTDETGTAKVGSYLSNAWGLYDMHGNVGEHCIDWWQEGDLVASTDPIGAEAGTQRSVRGGTWGNYSDHNRSAARTGAMVPGGSTIYRGFRPVINFADFSMKKVVNLQASDGTEPNGIRLTWTAVPGAEKYVYYRGETPKYEDAVGIEFSTTNTYLHCASSTNTYWYWVRAVVDGKYCSPSAPDSGYRVNYALTVTGGSGSTNCLGNTKVTITAAAAPTGYTFKEWTGAAADVALLASKTAASTTLRMPGRAVALTATYQPNAYAVKFNANGGTGTMANESFTYDAAKALTANAFTRTGYTYQGWATSATGAKVYSNKQSVSNLTATANGTVNLYAVWTANAYTVKFNANGGSGTMANESFTYDTAKALTANAFTRTGYTYQGWATSATGAKVYSDKQSVSNLTATANGTFDLYAAWSANPYTVTFDANGGDGDAMGAQEFAYGTAQKLANGSYTKTGYTFLGWSTDPKATSATYADGASVSNLATGGTLKLYAVWRANTYTIRFLPNGAEGTMADQTFTYDKEASLTANVFTKDGFGFVGWCAEDELAVSYTNRQQVLNLTTDDDVVVTLTAKWTDTWYVDADAGDDANEGVSAEMPFKTIQHAIDLSVDGVTIIVADGMYTPIITGNKSITIRSVNGAEKTIIDGGYPTATNRCVYAGGQGGRTNTVVRGFTIQNGCTVGTAGAINGAGVAGGTLYDCVVKSNHCAGVGGGVVYSRAYDCVISDNDAYGTGGGGAYRAILSNCKLYNNYSAGNGGGACLGELTGCEVVSNLTEKNGGGVYDAVVINTEISGNEAIIDGGGVSGGTIKDCLVSNNVAHTGGGGTASALAMRCMIVDNECCGDESYGGGAFHGELQNCVVVCNRVRNKGDGSGVSVAVCRNCTIYGNTGGTLGVHAWLVNGLPGGTNYNCIVYGNAGSEQIDSRMVSFNCFTRDPMFVDAANGDFRLKGASPCVDMGNNKYVSGETDIRGNPRVQNDVVDLGAYEFTLPTELGAVPVEGTDAVVPVEWLGMYGYVDEDSNQDELRKVLAEVGDNGLPLWKSWVAGFEPWDPDSELTANIKVVNEDEVEVSWTPDLSSASPKRHYTVIGKTNLTDSAWVIPVNESHRFFKVLVSIGEPGRVKDVFASLETSADSVSVSWSAADMAIGYNVYRATVDDFSRAALVASVTDVEYADEAAVPGVEYRYWIVSVANGGEWLTSDVATGSRLIGTPRHVSASDGTSTDWITVTWDEVEGAVSYRVLRATTNSLDEAVEVGTSAGTSWMDHNATGGVIYTYWVCAVGASFAGEVSASDEGCLRLTAPTGVTASNGEYSDQVVISWNAVPSASHYRVYRSTSPSGSKTAISDWLTELSYSDLTAEEGVTYYYYVLAALNAEGLNSSSYSSGAVGGLKVGVPAGVYATDGTVPSGVTVSWREVAGATGYTVYRGTMNAPEDAQVLASTAGTTVDDTAAVPGMLYYYWVSATNAVSESAKSNVETGFRPLEAPKGVSATNVSGSDAVTVTWQPVVGAAFYRIYRGSRTGESYAVEIDTATETSYVDESVSAGRPYYYSVKAVGTSCESDFSGFVSGSR